MTQTSILSIYGTIKTTSRPIYGSSSNTKPCTGCKPNVPYIDTLVGFITLLKALKTSISRFYNPEAVTMPMEGSIGVKGAMGLPLYTRIQWGKLYRTLYGRFNLNDIVHINLLKDIYMSLGYDWRIDEWLVAWRPT